MSASPQQEAGQLQLRLLSSILMCRDESDDEAGDSADVAAEDECYDFQAAGDHMAADLQLCLATLCLSGVLTAAERYGANADALKVLPWRQLSKQGSKALGRCNSRVWVSAAPASLPALQGATEPAHTGCLQVFRVADVLAKQAEVEVQLAVKAEADNITELNKAADEDAKCAAVFPGLSRRRSGFDCRLADVAVVAGQRPRQRPRQQRCSRAPQQPGRRSGPGRSCAWSPHLRLRFPPRSGA